MPFYINILIEESLYVYSDNTISRFRFRLPRLLELAQGAREVGLYQLAYPRSASGTELQHVFLYCDLNDPQFVGNNLARCLRIVHYRSPDLQHVFDNEVRAR